MQLRGLWAAIVSALGIIVTVLMLPETKGKTLEELNEEAQKIDKSESAILLGRERRMQPSA